MCQFPGEISYKENLILKGTNIGFFKGGKEKLS
jgi:hypothetical protein